MLLVTSDQYSPALRWNGGLRVTTFRSLAEAGTRLVTPPQPAVFLIDWRSVEDDHVLQLHAARAATILPSAAYVNRVDHTNLQRVWTLGALQVPIVHEGPTAEEQVRRLANVHPLGIGLVTRRKGIANDHPCFWRLLHLLESNPEARVVETGELARLAGTTRTELYEKLSREKSPSPREIQLLVRFLAAGCVLRMRGSDTTAAKAAAFSDGASLRKSVKTRIGLSIRQLRTLNVEEIIEQWFKVHTGRTHEP